MTDDDKPDTRTDAEKRADWLVRLLKLYRSMGERTEHARRNAMNMVLAALKQEEGEEWKGNQSWKSLPALLLEALPIEEKLAADKAGRAPRPVEFSTDPLPPWVVELVELFREMDSPIDSVREKKLTKALLLLEQHGRSWNDTIELLQPSASTSMATNPPPPEPMVGEELFFAVRDAYAAYTIVDYDHHHVAYALMTLLGWGYVQFRKIPRMASWSPLSGAGKSTALLVGSMLTPLPFLTVNATGPSLFRELLKNPPPRLFLDEIDNWGLHHDPDKMTVIRDGYQRGAFVTRSLNKKTSIRYPIFGFVWLGCIGTTSLPKPLLRRTIRVRHETATEAEMEALAADLDETDPEIISFFRDIYHSISEWAKTVVLDKKLPMPQGVKRGSQTDCWRPLLAIAHSLGPEVYRLACEAAVFMCAQVDDSHVEARLFSDLLVIFNRAACGPPAPGEKPVPGSIWDRDTFPDIEPHPADCAEFLSTRTIMAHLLLLNRWQYYRGKDGNQAARALNAHIMADLIGQWVQPYPSAVYPKGMKRTDPLCKPARGYYRRSFEEGPNGRPGPWQRYATESPEDIELEREKPWGSSEAEIGDDAAAESPSVTEPAETVTPLQARQTGRTSRASAQQRARRRSRKPTAAKPRRSARKPKPTRRRKRRAPRPLNRR